MKRQNSFDVSNPAGSNRIEIGAGLQSLNVSSSSRDAFSRSSSIKYQIKDIHPFVTLIMQKQRLRSVFIILLLVGVLCNLYITSTNRRISSTVQNSELHKQRSPKHAHHFPMASVLKGKQLPFHQVYEPREVGFPVDIHIPNQNLKPKIILVWTSWNSVRKTINYYFLQSGNRTFIKYKCPNPKCVVTFQRKNLRKADAIMFHLIDTDIQDLPTIRHPHQIWILYNMEPPWVVEKQAKSPLHLLNNIFNWTMSYRSNSDVIAKYGFTKPFSDAKSYGLNNVLKKKLRTVVWFVSDCSTDSRREDYVTELKKYIDIDVYGKCGDRECYPSQSSTCYEEVLKRYKFYLSFENAICRDYVTEKFFNVYNYDIVPVVLGAVNYSSLAPKSAFISAALYPQPKLLAEALLKIAQNETIYKEFLRKKASFKAYLDPWMCRLCDRLHSSSDASVLEDVEKWFIADAECKRWNSTVQTYTNIEPLST
ncbi:Glycoprotein 3-alpha-L-fucosyltransferase A [Araneus ventricosus]|uniref:Fucosyltransferase n=1 Tax=Araneus ventricosus TaxID=182803 RepID=A0A4Y2F3W6_ARAVE|nr:Glycoprotein 3-alpha-L-fucosyltransferase A [Araneus ventricosus]